MMAVFIFAFVVCFVTLSAAIDSGVAGCVGVAKRCVPRGSCAALVRYPSVASLFFFFQPQVISSGWCAAGSVLPCRAGQLLRLRFGRTKIINQSFTACLLFNSGRVFAHFLLCMTFWFGRRHMKCLLVRDEVNHRSNKLSTPRSWVASMLVLVAAVAERCESELFQTL
jgi:hypothetical protein